MKNCATAGSPIPIYHQFVVGEIIAFIRGEADLSLKKLFFNHAHCSLSGIEGDCEMYKYLEDPGLMPVLSTVLKQVYKPKNNVFKKGN